MSDQPGSPVNPQDETREDPVPDPTRPDTTRPDTGSPGDPVPTLWEEGRHPVHVAHLVMGIAFAGLLLVWALLDSGVADGDDVRWLLPLPWLLAGTAGLAAAGRNARRRP